VTRASVAPAMAEERVLCPICAREFLADLDAPRAKRPFFPFCSGRCRAVDLGRWVDEEYRVSEPIVPPGAERPEEES